MKKTKRIVSLLLISLLAVGMTFMAGCSKKTEPAKSIAVTINDTDIYLNELMYYIMAVESNGAQYDAYYQQFTGTSYWDTEYSEGVTMREQAKEYVMDTAQMYEILYDKAVKAGYTLTDDEKTQAESNADQILSSISEEQLKITGFTKEVLAKVQEKLSVGGKYYQDLIDGFDIDEEEIKASINRDEYRQYNTEYLFIPTTELDENYEYIDLSEEEKAAAKTSITAALDKAKAGEEFSVITEEDDTITTSTLNFAIDDGTAEEAYQEAAVKLENDACTPDIVETETGYYIIKMVDNDSSEAYDQAVEEAISQAQEEAFDAEYQKMKEEYTVTINSDVWDPIVMGETTIVASDASADTITDIPSEDTTAGDSGTDNTGSDGTTDEE